MEIVEVIFNLCKIRYLKLSEKLDKKHKESEKQIKYADILGDLYQRGIVDEDGNVLDPP